jgi:hypothetical protein
MRTAINNVKQLADCVSTSSIQSFEHIRDVKLISRCFPVLELRFFHILDSQL